MINMKHNLPSLIKTIASYTCHLVKIVSGSSAREIVHPIKVEKRKVNSLHLQQDSVRTDSFS